MDSSQEKFIKLIEESVKGGVNYINLGKKEDGNNKLNDLITEEMKKLIPSYNDRQIEALKVQSILTTGQTPDNSNSPILSIYYENKDPGISYGDSFSAYAILTLPPALISDGYSIYIISVFTYAVTEYLEDRGWRVGTSRLGELKPVNGSNSNSRDKGIVFDLTYYS